MNNSTKKYIEENVKYQKVLCSLLKNAGFVPESGSEIFVRSIPFKENEYDLVRFFEKAGDIFQLRLMMSENGVDNRGYAYVTYTDQSSAKIAVDTLTKLPYKKKHYLKIEISLNNCRIFVGGIPIQKTKDNVWQELYRHGVRNIVDVIMYRSYSDRTENRGFVFVEFKTHEEAAYFRARYGKCLKLFDKQVIVDWSVPIPEVDEAVMKQVKIIYVRNLDVSTTPEEYETFILRYIERDRLEKVYKFKNYAFIHLKTRFEAEFLMKLLIGYYQNTSVEITWAKPPNRYTTTEFRQRRMNSLSSPSSSISTQSKSPETTLPLSPSSPQRNIFCFQHDQYHFDRDELEPLAFPLPSTPSKKYQSGLVSSPSRIAYPLFNRSSMNSIHSLNPLTLQNLEKLHIPKAFNLNMMENLRCQVETPYIPFGAFFDPTLGKKSEYYQLFPSIELNGNLSTAFDETPSSSSFTNTEVGSPVSSGSAETYERKQFLPYAERQKMRERLSTPLLGDFFCSLCDVTHKQHFLATPEKIDKERLNSRYCRSPSPTEHEHLIYVYEDNKIKVINPIKDYQERMQELYGDHKVQLLGNCDENISWNVSTEEKEAAGETDTAIIRKTELAYQRGKRVEPYVLFVGPSVTDNTHNYIIVDKIRYKFDTSARAVDTFKIFHVLNIHYPPESEHTYLITIT